MLNLAGEKHYEHKSFHTVIFLYEEMNDDHRRELKPDADSDPSLATTPMPSL